MLAGDLVAQWTADDLNGNLESGDVVERWPSSTPNDVVALSVGSPKLDKRVLNGHSAIRFESNPTRFDRLEIAAEDSPVSGADAFSVAVVFATQSESLVGSESDWYFNSGLVDANAFGLGQDWGISINASGLVGAGMGSPAKSLYAGTALKNDGFPHVAIFSREANELTLSVDGDLQTRTDVSPLPRDSRNVRIGSGGNAFEGHIAEVRFYDGRLDEREMQLLTETLTAKYFNPPAVPVSDAYSMPEDTVLTVAADQSVLLNDHDPDNDPFWAEIVDPPVNGMVDFSSNGTFIYTPNADFFGVDTFLYRLFDPDPSHEIAAVTIDVTQVNDPIVPVRDTFVTSKDLTLNVSHELGILSNDQNVDNRPLRAVVVQPPAHGNVSLDIDGSFSYEPAMGFVGVDSFSYRSDADGEPNSPLGTVDIHVLPEPVIISELGASNRNTIDDKDGDSSDWIELHNFGSHTIDLGGWYLTDDSDYLPRWRIPAIQIEPDQNLLVFASGKNRRNGDELHTDFKLSASGEYLAVVAADGETIIHQFSPVFPQQIRDVSYGIRGSILPRYEINYLSAPTPGETNASARFEPGLFIADVSHSPSEPVLGDDITVFADLRSVVNELQSVLLTFRLMYGTETSMAMVDDGSIPGDVAGDGVFTAIVSAAKYHQLWELDGNVDSIGGKMFRYFVSAIDDGGLRGRAPYLTDLDPDADISEQDIYYGGVFSRSLQTDLPRLHWFVPDPDWHINRGGTNNTRWSDASVYFDGEFYDNLKVRVRGQTTVNWSKPKFKFEFNPGRPFRYSDSAPRVDEFNLQSHYREKGATSYMGENLAFSFLQDIGVAAPNTVHFQVEQNGEFYSLASFVEQLDQTFLDRNGLDPFNAMYKANSSSARSTLEPNPSRAHYRKVTQKNAPFDDLNELTDALANRLDRDRSTYIFDHVNLPQVINNMAGNTILTNHDRLTKNYYMYHDQATAEWSRFPWDMDQAFAKRTDTNFASVLYGDTEHPQATGQPIYQNHLLDAILDTPATREMYLRRLRTLLDDYLATSYFEDRIDAYYERIADEAHQDHRRWRSGSIEAGVARLKDHIAFRRRQLLNDPLVPESAIRFASDMLVDADANVRVFVPDEANDILNWQRADYDDSTQTGWLIGTGGVGYETGTGYETFIGDLFADRDGQQSIDLLAAMDSTGDGVADTPSVYIRYPFHVDDPETIDGMQLLARYDDGFVAYVNGVEVVRQNVAGTPAWDRTAKSNHEATDAFELFDFSSLIQTAEVEFSAGQNVLAVHLMNRQVNSPDLLFQGQLVALTRSPSEYSMEFGQIEADPNNVHQQFVEIKNNDSTAIDVSGWRLNHSAPFQPGTVIPAQSSLFVAADVKAFRNRTSGPSGRMQIFVQGGLGILGGSETIRLLTDRGSSVMQFRLGNSLTGDFNLDGLLTASDIDLMCQEIRSGDGRAAFDVDQNGSVNVDDHLFLVEQLFQRQIGDANLDGVFDTADLVLIFQSAEYEDDQVGNSVWESGDWNCDGEFDSSDLVLSLQRSVFAG